VWPPPICHLGFGIFGAYSLPGAVVMQASFSGAVDGTGSSNAVAPNRRAARGRRRQAGRLGETGPRAATRLCGIRAQSTSPGVAGDARIAINFNLNVEAGGERSTLEGDSSSEDVLSDTGYGSYEGARSLMVESSFEYGPRVGCWRLMRIFKKFDVRISVLAVVSGLQRTPELARAFVEEGHELVSHGWRWIDYTKMDEGQERKHIALATEGLVTLTGQAPVGWFGGRPSVNTRRLLVAGRLSLRSRLSWRRAAVLGRSPWAQASCRALFV
jgi:peptidoglycan/xylan/chitin deacetylase (PgdA/CDA1 family)